MSMTIMEMARLHLPAPNNGTILKNRGPHLTFCLVGRTAIIPAEPSELRLVNRNLQQPSWFEFHVFFSFRHRTILWCNTYSKLTTGYWHWREDNWHWRDEKGCHPFPREPIGGWKKTEDQWAVFGDSVWVVLSATMLFVEQQEKCPTCKTPLSPEAETGSSWIHCYVCETDNMDNLFQFILFSQTPAWSIRRCWYFHF